MDDGDFDLHLPRSRPWANDDAPFAGLIPTGGTERRHMYDKKKRKKKRKPAATKPPEENTDAKHQQ